MEKPDLTPDTNLTASTVPMAKINGAAIRRLRESKGLTQLYLATVIGVTTDTISRWEHRRYPSIKLDNAEKLAQSLEVELEAILEQEEEELAEVPPTTPALESTVGVTQPVGPEPPPDHPATASSSLEPHRRSSPPWFLALLMLLSLAGLALWMKQSTPADMPIAAERILPPHVPDGQTFPVLIHVSANQPAALPFIIKESLPPGCRLIAALPPLTSDAGKEGIVKWISRSGEHTKTFAYIVQAPAKKNFGDRLPFQGSLTLSQGAQTQAEIRGAAVMEIAPFHWADVDRNGIIDDEEILVVYDRYSAMGQLEYDRELIDAIWAGKGYGWEKKSGKYVVRN